MHTHYDNLQLKEGAGPEVIKASYKALAQKWHPDRNPDKAEEATRVFRIITSAYEVLSDPEARSKYDAWLVEQRRGSTSNPGPHHASPQATKPDPRSYASRGNAGTRPKPGPTQTGADGGSHHRSPPPGNIHPPEQGLMPYRVFGLIVLLTAWYMVFGKRWTIESLIGHLFSK